MDTKKNKKNKLISTGAVPAQPDDRIPVLTGETIDPATMTVPQGTLGRHLALSMKLLAQRPAELTPEQARRRQRLVRAVQLAGRARERWRRRPRTNVAVVRSDALSIASTLIGVLQLLARSKVPGLAEQAAAARDALIAREVMLARLTPEELWVELDTMRAALAGDRELVAAVTRLVPEALVQAVVEVTERLGQAGGMKDPVAAEGRTETARAHDYLVRTMNAYLRSIAAGVDEEDERSVDAARAALEPVAAFRAANARRKTRGAVEEEEEDDPGDDGAPVAAVAPAPVPVAVAVGGDPA